MTKQERADRRQVLKARKEAELEADLEQDGTFAFIAGYTSGGAPYGVTWEELKTDPSAEAGDDADDLPFK